MKIKIVLVFLLLFVGELQAQKGVRFFFEVSGGVNSFAMERFNQYYVDSFAKINNIHDVKTTKGFNRSVVFHYFISSTFSIGTTFTYLYSKEKFENATIDFPYNESSNIINSDIIIQNDAKIFGLSVAYYLPFFRKKTNFYTKHFSSSINATFGYAYTKSLLNYSTVNRQLDFKARNIFASFALGIDYKITKKLFFSSIGIKIGYNQLESKVLKDKDNTDWIVLGYYPINLDFSGFYGSLVFKLGK
ncbi:MAG: hypothetical protein HYU67_01540 [Flavobacteriia bacterium]|nr:hypothetical protein [Flavobacteriia bacterium]